MGTGWNDAAARWRAVAVAVVACAAMTTLPGQWSTPATGLPEIPTSLPPPSDLPPPLSGPLFPAPPDTTPEQPVEPSPEPPPTQPPLEEPPPAELRGQRGDATATHVAPTPPASRGPLGGSARVKDGGTPISPTTSAVSTTPASTHGEVGDTRLATAERAAEPTGVFLGLALMALAMATAGLLRVRTMALAGGGSVPMSEPRTRPPEPAVLPPPPPARGIGPDGEIPLVGAGAVPEALRAHCEWTDRMVTEAGLSVLEIPFVTVGGGLGSFATVTVLRIAGVRKDDIAVVTLMDRPYDTFRFRAEASQMDDDDLLRSDSGSRIDNIWGFPGFAFEEARKRRSLRPMARVLAEPVLCEYYNPRCADMYEAVDREAARIGWPDMLVKGRVAVVRRRQGGGYFAVVESPPGAAPTPPVAIRCRYLHLGVGYPALRLLPDLQGYRRRYGDRHRMVHAYEPHDHVYEALLDEPGTVLLRGTGIAASRVLERLIDDCERRGAQTRIVHLFRHYEVGRNGHGWLRRQGTDGFTYQSFNFPKAAFGGQLAGKVASLEGRERDAFIRSIDRSTTPRRGHWQEQLERARRQGWYSVQIGQVEDVSRSSTGRVSTTIRPWYGQSRRTVEADFVIDATGLDGDVTRHPAIADLLACGRARLNAFGRLDVDKHFEVSGARSGTGRMYASGSITMGAPVAPVDSFFGLNQAALEICDDLAGEGFCARIGTRQSVQAWWRWARREPL